MNSSKPTILKEGNYKTSDIDDFISNNDISFQKDIYESQLEELFEINNPQLVGTSNFNSLLKEFLEAQEQKNQGDWIYFPWSKMLLHTVSEKDYFLLRTNRNRSIITPIEQAKLNNFVVAIAGLSVGSNIAHALSYTGISNTMKLSDFDTLDTTNLNRVRARLDQIGEEKIEILARQIYELNPYADLHLHSEGVSSETVENFLSSKKKVNLLFEIIDDFKMKILLRVSARKLGIPVIMLTNLGDRVLIDIERYDIEPNLEIFNGKIGSIGQEIMDSEITPELEKEFAINIVGKENLPEKVLNSVLSIGTTLVGRPQLATTAQISAGLGSYFARQIALGKNIPSGRTLVDFDKIIHE